MSVVPEPSTAFDIERLLVAMRPRLHRYCARMAKVRDCRLVAGLVERHLAILVFDPGAPDKSPNISCCSTRRPATSRPSAISAASVTSSMALIIGSERNS